MNCLQKEIFNFLYQYPIKIGFIFVCNRSWLLYILKHFNFKIIRHHKRRFSRLCSKILNFVLPYIHYCIIVIQMPISSWLTALGLLFVMNMWNKEITIINNHINYMILNLVQELLAPQPGLLHVNKETGNIKLFLGSPLDRL